MHRIVVGGFGTNRAGDLPRPGTIHLERDLQIRFPGIDFVPVHLGRTVKAHDLSAGSTVIRFFSDLKKIPRLRFMIRTADRKSCKKKQPNSPIHFKHLFP